MFELLKLCFDTVVYAEIENALSEGSLAVLEDTCVFKMHRKVLVKMGATNSRDHTHIFCQAFACLI